MARFLLTSRYPSALLVLVLFVYAASTPIYAQGPGEIKLWGVTATQFYAGSRLESASDLSEYRWRLSYNEPLDDRPCVQFNALRTGWFVPIEPVQFFNSNSQVFDPYGLAGYGQLYAEAWENDDAPECTFNGGDDGHCGPNQLTIRFIDYAPGVTHTIVFDICSVDPFAVEYQFAFTIPTPSRPTTGIPESSITCSGSGIYLQSRTYTNPSHQNAANYKYTMVWEYRKGVTGPFVQFGETDLLFDFSLGSYGTTRLPVELLNDLKDITTLTDVQYRVKTRMRVLAGVEAGNVYESVYSDGAETLHLSPKAPIIENLVTTTSCPNVDTGTISVTVSGLGEYIYSIRTGENTTPCTPNPEGTDDCGGVSQRVTGNSFTVSDIAPGRYTLMVTNKGGDAGVCPTFSFFTIDAIPDLTQSVTAVPVSCYGESTGEVTIVASDGLAPYTYKLKLGAFELINDNGLFSGLTAGNYTAIVQDECGQILSQTVNVTQPIEIVATVTGTSLSCADPFNGIIDVAVQQGGGNYTYQLEKGGAIITELENTTSNTWNISSLDHGDYLIRIIDTDHVSCQPFTQAVSIAAPGALTIPQENVEVVNPTCYGRSDGKVLLHNEGGAGVVYELINENTSESIAPNAEMEFLDLAGGNYQLKKKRTTPGCQDEYIFPSAITIAAPEQISIALNIIDISCQGFDNGAITATITGSTPGDQLRWETRIGSDWVTLPFTTQAIDNLVAGTYRVILTNSRACSAQSEEVEITDPPLLTIASVDVSNKVCFEDHGSVSIVAQGGGGSYTYNYTTGNNTISDNVGNIELPDGIYQASVVDNRGCEIVVDQTIEVTSPPSPLSFSYVISDFDGFNVPCHGATGYLDLSAVGGNGTNLTGYTYSSNGVLFQAASRLENIPAGLHVVYVQDMRGCIVSSEVLLTEPASNMTADLISKTDVKCYGEESGVITVGVTGGSAPYHYTLNNVLKQDGSSFTGLPPGDFTVEVEDKFGCSASLSATIELLNTPMFLTLQKNDVHCFDGSDGQIEAIITGGNAPYTYLWSGLSENTSRVSGLRAGEYTIEIRDSEGCSQQDGVTLNQPDQIGIEIVAIPVCVGQATGELRTKATGGVAPFQYAINSATTFQESPIFSAIPAGEYSVFVKDAHDCESVANAEVKVRNDLPTPDFIVATRENVLDTLVVKEISVPKPDSVEWFFDPTIIIVANDEWSPQIKVEEVGNYNVSMTGYFGGCAYSKELTLTINPYDPKKPASSRLAEPSIKVASATPNPNSGQFSIALELNSSQYILISVIDIFGVVHYKKEWDEAISVTDTIQLSDNSSSGIYIVQIMTETEIRQIRIVVNR